MFLKLLYELCIFRNPTEELCTSLIMANRTGWHITDSSGLYWTDVSLKLNQAIGTAYRGFSFCFPQSTQASK